MNIFNTFYHCSNKEVIRTNGTKRLDLCAQMKFREKENKQASHDSCSKTPTYNVRAKEGNRIPDVALHRQVTKEVITNLV